MIWSSKVDNVNINLSLSAWAFLLELNSYDKDSFQLESKQMRQGLLRLHPQSK